MRAMFDDLGALGNVTAPGAFRGQAMNLYTGGSLMMRSPARNLPLASATLPSLRAGCAGIDLYGGAFSFINKQQFVSLLQNIGANAVGYAFKLALQSISPDIDKLLTELQDQINKVNALNINSCEAAQALVNSVAGEYGASVQSGCASISQYLGTVADRADARMACATGAASVVKTAAASTDPTVREATFIQGNVTWDALQRIGGDVSREDKELLLSLVGTVIVSGPDDNGAGARPAHLEPTLHALRDLMLGQGPAATDGLIEVELYRCDEETACLAPTRTRVAITPFTTRVVERLRRMSERIATRTAQDSTDIGFVNQTTEPVYRMLSVANAIPGSGTAETLIETYKDVIALDYAHTFLGRALRQAGAALAQATPRSAVERRYLDDLRERARATQAELLQEKQAAYGKVRSVAAMTQDLQRLERQLWGAMPTPVRAMLDFGPGSARGP
jgi:conjugative transfer pilus assembly protein TraH